MKFNKWTLALAGAGVVSLASVAQAEEAQMSQVLTAVSSTTLSGYVDTSAIWKFGTGNNALPGRAFDGVGKLDGFNLNVASVTIEKPLSEDQWAAGYGLQLLFGPDAIGYNVSTGNGTTTAATGDFGVKQAYVALRTPIGNGIDWKIGTFNTIIGYESFESYLNPNYSRSFGWQLEPTQHTGLLGSYKFTDAVSVSLGVANTWSAGINARSTRAESHKAYMASVTVTAPESWGFLKGSAWYAGVVEGFSGAGRDAANIYVGGSIATPVEGLSVGAAFDYRFNNAANTVTPANIVGQPDSNWAYAIAGYTSFQASEKWKLNARVDYTTGSDGTWFNAGGAGSDEQNELGSLTLTADYALWANVISRAEFRWDHSFTSDRPYGITDKNALTLAANVIYKF
jgi:putative OmpL-like beta-barrel porin-2